MNETITMDKAKVEALIQWVCAARLGLSLNDGSELVNRIRGCVHQPPTKDPAADNADAAVPVE